MSHRGIRCFLLLAIGMLLLVSCGGDDHPSSTAAVTPVANAGSNQNVTLGATVTLNGTGSTGASTYAWTLSSVPTGSVAALSGATTATPTFTPDIVGVYEAQLIVTSSTGTMSAPAKVSIAVSGNVLTNSSFESGLTGWTTGSQFEVGATGTCSYNGATAPGTETLTGLTGFPATDGTQIALGSVSSTSAGGPISSCALFQDVTIPVHATTATFTFDIGVKGNINGFNNGYKVGIYSTATGVPGFSAAPLVSPTVFASVFSADATLQSRTSSSFAISARAGQTVRFAIINAVQNNMGEVIGLDNVKLIVNVTAP